MIIDLHMHTTESDGEYYPREVVQMAKQRNVDIIAITDHDTGAGIFDAIDEGNKIGVKVIPGIEFTATDSGVKKMHILGYNIDYKLPEFIKLYEELMKDVERKNQDLIKATNSLGADISIEDIRKICKSKNIRKPVIAQVLLDKKYIKLKEEANTKYFSQEVFKKIRKENTNLNPKQIIELIKKFGGTAILAHPYSLGLKGIELENKIDELISYGLEGMECFHSRQSIEQMLTYEEIAHDRNLIISKGSDFHGLNIYKDTYIGMGKFDNLKNVTMERLTKIQKIIK